MSKGERLQLIKARHRRRLRSQGLPVFLSEAERKAIDVALDMGEPSDVVAERHGVTRRQVERQGVNRLFYAGLSPDTIVLSRKAQRALENL